MKVKNLSGIVMRIAAVLICLVLFSAHLASGMFARYTVSGGGDGSARVASYHVDIISADNNQLDLIGNNTDGVATYRFKVENQSEVPVKYQLSVVFSDPLDEGHFVPNYSNVQIDGIDPDSHDVDDAGKHTYDFIVTNNQLSAHSSSDVHTLTFNTSMSWTETTDNRLADTAIQVNTGNKYPVKVFADVTQIN